MITTREKKLLTLVLTANGFHSLIHWYIGDLAQTDWVDMNLFFVVFGLGFLWLSEK